MAKGLNQVAREALRRGDYGEQVADGFFLKDLGTVQPSNPKASRASVEKRRPIPLQKREELVGIYSAKLMDYYIDNLNNPLIVNPIRDGIPQCAEHPFPPGCWHGCQTGVLPRVYDHTLGDVFTWVKGLVAHNYRNLTRKRQELRGVGATL